MDLQCLQNTFHREVVPTVPISGMTGPLMSSCGEPGIVLERGAGREIEIGLGFENEKEKGDIDIERDDEAILKKQFQDAEMIDTHSIYY
nr:unnamed protein product [Callosobruchus analis]